MLERMEEEIWRNTQLEVLGQDDMDLDVDEAVKFMTTKTPTRKKNPINVKGSPFLRTPPALKGGFSSGDEDTPRVRKAYKPKDKFIEEVTPQPPRQVKVLRLKIKPEMQESHTTPKR